MSPQKPSRRSFGLIALLTLCLPGLGALVVLGTLDSFAEPLRQGGTSGALLFCLATALVTGLALVPTNIMSIAGGWIYGGLSGAIWVLLGVTLGAVLGHAWTSRLAGPGLRQMLERNPRLAEVHRSLLGDNLRRVGTILCLCRLSPLIPFASINLLCGASRIPLPLFVGGTVVGMLPRVAALAFTGASLAEIDFARPGDSVSLIIGIAATLAVVIVVTQSVKRALARVGTEAAEEPADPRDLAARD